MQKKYKFGIEIEFKGVEHSIIKEYFTNRNLSYKVKEESDDCSKWHFSKEDREKYLYSNLDSAQYIENFHEEEFFVEKVPGGEIITSILINSKENWDELSNLCEFMKSNNVFFDQYCAIHYHFDFDDYEIDDKVFLNLLKLIYKYEEIIYKYTQGKFGKNREATSEYASSIRNEFNRLFKTGEYNFDNIIDKPLLPNILKKEKIINLSYWIKKYNNSAFKLNTIEFRSANSTFDIEDINKYYHFFNNILIASVREEINISEIKPNVDYENLNLDQDLVLEFGELIYNYDNEHKEEFLNYMKKHDCINNHVL